MTTNPELVIGDCRVIGIVRETSADSAASEVRRLAANGIRAVEVSLGTPHALDALTRVRAELADRDICCGVGTVLNARQLHDAAAAGAQFAVSPIATAELADCARDLGMVSVFGATSATECYLAAQRGAQFVKLFPARLWSPAALRDLLQALPTLRLVPTGGVSLDDAPAWLAAGAAAVGLGGALRAEPSADRMAAALADLARRD